MNAELLHPDRLFPTDERTRNFARDLYARVEHLPIVSPHGHTDPEWFANDTSFTDAVDLLLRPDHYVLRMLYSHGVSLDELLNDNDKRKVWKIFASRFHLFRGTPSSLWLNHVFHAIFDIGRPFNEANADYFFDTINERLKSKEFKPRALFDRFKIEVLATTDAATDNLEHHQKIKSDWGKRIIPSYRPDGVVDPEHEDFTVNLRKLAELTREDVYSWSGYLNAHRKRREFFKSMGATAADHGPSSARTLNLSSQEAEKLFTKILSKTFSPQDADDFRAHVLWQMAAMSSEDGLVMQIHSGSHRNHNPWLFKTFGRDKGADIPQRTEYTNSLKPLLDSFGNNKNLKLILFTLDESTYSRELAPIAGHYPAVKLGPAWWFHDSPEGMIRHRTQTVETAGFYNVTGFIDDTRAFLSIPARHDMSRRIDARLLAQWVAEHRLQLSEAQEVITDIHSTHAKACFNL